MEVSKMGIFNNFKKFLGNNTHTGQRRSNSLVTLDNPDDFIDFDEDDHEVASLVAMESPDDSELENEL